MENRVFAQRFVRVNTSKGPCACGYLWRWVEGLGWGGMLQFIATATARRFSCTSTHMSCYAAARSLALPHIRHAMSQNSLRSLETTSARKAPQMAKLWPKLLWVREALGRKSTKKSSSLARTQTLDRRWDWLKTWFPSSWIHIKTADKTSGKK